MDVICLTEIKISRANRNFYSHNDYDTSLNLPPDPLNNAPKEGLAILIRKEICNQKTEVTSPVPGKLTKVTLEINNEDFIFFCLYAPSQSDSVSNKFFTNFFQDITPHNNTIYIGDFNSVLDPSIDRKDPSIPYHKPKTSKSIRDHMMDNNLVDPWRTSNPSKKEFSWMNSRSASRIDYTLIPAHLYHQVAEVEYITPPHKH